jgi:voltage-dependent calcium channel
MRTGRHQGRRQGALTSNMAINGVSKGWEAVDYERAAGDPSRWRRGQYKLPASPLRRTGTELKNVSNRIKRASMRHVNVGGSDLENQMRLRNSDDTPANKEE